MVQILGVRTEIDSVLSVLAPMGLWASADRPSLLVDLDLTGPHYPSRRSLADLVADGPTRDDLNPGPEGLALLRNGGVDWKDAAETIERLAGAWPSISLRVGTSEGGLPWPVIPVVPLLPGFLAANESRAAVWQATRTGQTAPGPGPLLPALGRRAIHSILEARAIPAGRWVRVWRQVWELPWP